MSTRQLLGCGEEEDGKGQLTRLASACMHAPTRLSPPSRQPRQGTHALTYRVSAAWLVLMMSETLRPNSSSHFSAPYLA